MSPWCNILVRTTNHLAIVHEPFASFTPTAPQGRLAVFYTYSHLPLPLGFIFPQRAQYVVSPVAGVCCSPAKKLLMLLFKLLYVNLHLALPLGFIFPQRAQHVVFLVAGVCCSPAKKLLMLLFKLLLPSPVY